MKYILGSISTATLRTEDLLLSFADTLENLVLLNGDHFANPENFRDRDAVSDAINETREIDPESEDTCYFLNEKLFDVLASFAPPYFYFGAHPGDGADFGFWLMEDFQQAMRDDDVVIVDDLSAVSPDHTGECCIINDHGNVTFGTIDQAGDFTEIWAIV